MKENETDAPEDEVRPDHADDNRPAAEKAEHPAPGIKHETEPDAENIMPAEDRAGTL